MPSNSVIYKGQIINRVKEKISPEETDVIKETV